MLADLPPPAALSGHILLAVIAVAVGPGLAIAQQTDGPVSVEQPPGTIVEALITDRPGFSCGPYVVGTGVLQIESGVAIDWSRQADQRTSGLSTPLVLRYGVSDRVEMRLKTSGLVVAHESAADMPRTATEGIAAPTIEAKWQMTESAGPTVALLLSTALPIGSPALRPGELQPAALLSAELPVGGAASVSFDVDLEDRFAQGFFAGVLSFALADNWGGFVEAAVATGDDTHSDATIFIDGGVSWVVNPDLQLDVSAIRGVTVAATDWTAMVGVSLRFR